MKKYMAIIEEKFFGHREIVSLLAKDKLDANFIIQFSYPGCQMITMMQTAEVKKTTKKPHLISEN